MARSENAGLGLFEDTASAAGNFPTRCAATTGRRSTTTSARWRRAWCSPDAHAGRARAPGHRPAGRPAAEQAARDRARRGRLRRPGRPRERDPPAGAGAGARPQHSGRRWRRERIREEAPPRRRPAAQSRPSGTAASCAPAGSSEIDASSGSRLAGRGRGPGRPGPGGVDGPARGRAPRGRVAAAAGPARRRSAAPERRELETDGLRREVEREVADSRAELARGARGRAWRGSAASTTSCATQTRAMLAEAAEHHAQSTGRLRGRHRRVGAGSGRRPPARPSRSEPTPSPRPRSRVATASKQAAAITARTQQEFAWRKQQLRRETELLRQRKQAVLSQLGQPVRARPADRVSPSPTSTRTTTAPAPSVRTGRGPPRAPTSRLRAPPARPAPRAADSGATAARPARPPQRSRRTATTARC